MREKGDVTEVVTLMEGEWSRYRSGHFNEGFVIREVVNLMEGEYSCYGGGQFKGGRMVKLRRWKV